MAADKNRTRRSIGAYLGRHGDVRPEAADGTDDGGRRARADGTSGGGGGGGDHLLRVRGRVDARWILASAALFLIRKRVDWNESPWVVTHAFSSTERRPRRRGTVSAGRCFSPTSFSATTPETRANTRATRPTDPSRPPTRAPTEPARISSSHGHHARCVRARSIPPARLRASASPRASRHRPTPRLLADAEPPPTAPTSTGVRQTTLNATRSSNFVRFMLACVPSRASSTRARARGQPLARRDPPSFPRAQLCARARVRAPRAISASAND